VGITEGMALGEGLGMKLGLLEGIGVLGACVGIGVGTIEGDALGDGLGIKEGD